MSSPLPGGFPRKPAACPWGWIFGSQVPGGPGGRRAAAERGRHRTLGDEGNRLLGQDLGVLGSDIAEPAAQRLGGDLAGLPASSTSVGPAPTRAKLSQRCRLTGSVTLSAISNAPDTRRRIFMASSMVFIPGAKPPKSIASNGVLALDPWTRQVLAAHRYRQPPAPGDGCVFARPGGRPYAPGYLTRRFIGLVRREGLPPIRLPDLRHGAARDHSEPPVLAWVWHGWDDRPCRAGEGLGKPWPRAARRQGFPMGRPRPAGADIRRFRELGLSGR